MERKCRFFTKPDLEYPLVERLKERGIKPKPREPQGKIVFQSGDIVIERASRTMVHFRVFISPSYSQVHLIETETFMLLIETILQSFENESSEEVDEEVNQFQMDLLTSVLQMNAGEGSGTIVASSE